MKLLIVNQYFYPDVAATAQLLTDLSEDLADKEMDITVLTGNSNYLGGKLDLSSNGKYIKSKVIRVNSFSLGKTSTMRRLLDYLSFYILGVSIRAQPILDRLHYPWHRRAVHYQAPHVSRGGPSILAPYQRAHG